MKHLLLLLLIGVGNLMSQEKILVIGHRGACGYTPENTLTSFEQALSFGVDAVELDVFLAKSGELVVIHDATLDRTTNGKGKVGDLTLREIQNYKCSDGKPVPTLAEVFDLIDRRCVVNVELKGDQTGVATAKLIQYYVEEKGWSYQDFFISSFNHHELFSFHELQPEVPTGALMEGIPFHYASFAEDIGATHVVLHLLTLNQAFVDDAHKRGLKVFVYTVNKEEDLLWVKALGVDGVISNYPDRAIRLIR